VAGKKCKVQKWEIEIVHPAPTKVGKLAQIFLEGQFFPMQV